MTFMEVTAVLAASSLHFRSIYQQKELISIQNPVRSTLKSYLIVLTRSDAPAGSQVIQGEAEVSTAVLEQQHLWLVQQGGSATPLLHGHIWREREENKTRHVHVGVERKECLSDKIWYGNRERLDQ